MNSKNVLLVILGIAVILFAIYFFTQNGQSPVESESPLNTEEQVNDSETQISSLVSNFGSTLKNISLLSPTAPDDIEDNYAQYVSSELLSTWKSDPENAPGRATSSPWPDRIEIISMDNISPGKYTINAQIVEVTNPKETTEENTIAITTPVVITVNNINGNWLITSFEEVSGE